MLHIKDAIEPQNYSTTGLQWGLGLAGPNNHPGNISVRKFWVRYLISFLARS